MTVYEHCAYRNSWDCGDGYCNCKTCDSFKLDFDTLTKSNKKQLNEFYRTKTRKSERRCVI